MMYLVGSYGTRSGMTLESFLFLAGPPVTLVAGIGLIRRRRWARFYLILLLAAILTHSIIQLARGQVPQSTRISADGVPTTTLASDGSGSIPMTMVSAGLLALLLSRKVRSEFGASARCEGKPVPMAAPAEDWRVGHRGRDGMYYEERHAGVWDRLEIDGEMLTGRAHHVIYFASAQRWLAYPAWAQGRRDEIIARIQSQFREPDYEYHGVSD